MLRAVHLFVLITPAQGDEREGGDSPGEFSVEELVQRKDPGADDWTTEKLHNHAKHQLKALGEVLADAHNRAELDPLLFFTADSAVGDLRPTGWSERRTFGKLQVRTAKPPMPLAVERRDVRQALADLMKPYGALSGQRFAFKALRIEGHDDGRRFNTTMFFQCYGPAPGGVVEQHGVWDIGWRIGADPEHPLTERIVVRKFSEAHAPGEFFSDRSAAVLGGVRAWHEQLQYGADYWHNRVDTLGGVTFLGHQGIAVGDVNGDGLDDVYVAQSNGMPNLLLVHHRNGTVRDVANEAGVDFLDDTKGVLIVDIDNDGDQDLCIAMGPVILVLANDGAGAPGFAPLAALHAPDESAFYSLTAVDFDADGDLDIYATRYVVGRYGVSIPLPWHDANNGPSNHMYRNEGGGRFADVTREIGLDANNRRFSLAASWADYDDDGDPDLYVANDFGRNNLYRNDGGTFTDVAAASGTEDQAAGMGVSWADYDLDGRLDLHVGNMFSSAGNRIAYQRRFKADQSEAVQESFRRHAWGNSLYRGAGDGTFEDASGVAGIRMGRWSWGARFVDITLDGYADIVSPNGFITNTQKDDL